MGRNSYEKVLSFPEWPYDKPVFVATKTLTEVPEALLGKVVYINGTPVEMVSHIHSQGYKNLYIDGGRLIQDFLSADMIDQLIVTRIPILLGRGIPLFGDLNKPLKFQHQSTQSYDNGLVNSHYAKAR